MNRKQSQGLAFALALYTLRGVSTEKCLELMRTTFWYFRSEKRNDKAFISQSVFFASVPLLPLVEMKNLMWKGPSLRLCTYGCCYTWTLICKLLLPLVFETQTGLSLTKVFVNQVLITSNTQVVNSEVRCSLTKSAPSSGAATPLQAGCTCVQLCGHKPLADVGIVSNISAVFKQCNRWIYIWDDLIGAHPIWVFAWDVFCDFSWFCRINTFFHIIVKLMKYIEEISLIYHFSQSSSL